MKLANQHIVDVGNMVLAVQGREDRLSLAEGRSKDRLYIALTSWGTARGEAQRDGVCCV